MNIYDTAMGSASQSFANPCKPHSLQMKLARVIVCLEEQKVVRKKPCKTQKRFFRIVYSHLTGSTCHLPMCAACVHVSLPSIGNTKQTIGEGKSGPVENNLTRWWLRLELFSEWLLS